MNRLKEIITRDCGLKMSWVAKEIGISANYFGSKVAGVYPFSEREINRLSEVIGVNPRVLKTEIERINGKGASPQE